MEIYGKYTAFSWVPYITTEPILEAFYSLIPDCQCHLHLHFDNKEGTIFPVSIPEKGLLQQSGQISFRRHRNDELMDVLFWRTDS